MDFFQGSTPLKFIPFRLDYIPEEDEQIPESTSVESASNAINRPTTTVTGSEPQGSPLSVDSETDVKAFADAKVKLMEKAQSPIQEESNQEYPSNSEQVGDLKLETDPTLPEDRNRTSTLYL